jgi:4-amino-4-deoxy-L-arabinose transferase-like glycosyltransferase
MKKLIIPIILLISLLARVLFLDRFPIGLNADEAAIGYNAYSLIQTGHDEHGMSWPLVFRSFDDYKPPLYFYLVLPFVYLFGLNEWSVRLPSALLGTATVYLVYLLAKKLFTKNELPSYISALAVGLSPWAIHFSRGGWEVNAATFFITLGAYGFVKKSYPVFVGALVASLYTYHSARVIAPLLALSLLIIFYRQIRWKSLFINGIIGICLSLPVLLQMFSASGTSRFTGVSIFADPGPLAWVHEMRRTDPNPNSFITKIKYNRYFAYSGSFIKNYFSHYSLEFLYVKGDVIDRSRTPGVGQLLYTTLPFLAIGLYVVLANLNHPTYRFILSWLLIAPLAASLTFQSPHALRSQNMIIPLSLIIGVGFATLIKLFQSGKINKNLLIVCNLLFVVILSAEFSRYLYQYYIVYPKTLPIAWQYGFKDLSSYLSENQSKYDQIVITTRYDQPYILLAFYLKYPPQKLQSELVMSDRDNYGFATGLSFGQYQFRKINYEIDKNLKNSLLVTADEPVDQNQILRSIGYGQGQPTLYLVPTSLSPVP